MSYFINPSGSIQVTGLKFTTNPVSGYVMTSDASGNMSLRPVSGAGVGDVVSTASNTFTNTNRFNGNVGFGLAPNYLVDVSGFDLTRVARIQNRSTGINNSTALSVIASGGTGGNQIALHVAASDGNMPYAAQFEAGAVCIGQLLGQGGAKLNVLYSPAETSVGGVINLGGGSFAGGALGFHGHDFGTSIALNELASFTGDFLNIQKNGSGRFSISSSGAVAVRSDLTTSGHFKMPVGGSLMYIKTGVNASIGKATLINGVATINTSLVTNNSNLSAIALPGSLNVGILSVGGINPGSGFTIVSTNVLQGGDINWAIIEMT